LFVAALSAGLIVVAALGLLVFLPADEDRGSRVLSRVEIGPVNWSGIPLETAIAEMNRMIAESGEGKFKVLLSQDAAHEATKVVHLHLEGKAPASEVAVYAAQISGAALWPISTPDGLMIAPPGDHRPWRAKFRSYLEARFKEFKEAW
jgi:hypothetical protein